MIRAPRGLIVPEPSVDTQWWWDALGEGRITMPCCEACRRRFFPPQPFCPWCGSASWCAVEPDGRGSVYSWIVAHRAFAPQFAKDTPYAIVAVDLVDGGRLIGRYLGDPMDLRPDLPVACRIYHVQKTSLLGFACV